MTLALLRDRISASVEWIATGIAARPKVALMVWLISLAVVAWMV